jgi:hypothetical protein
MWETKALNTVNFPAAILSSPVRIWWERPIYSGKGFGIFLSDIAYIIAIYFFWWWVGVQIDDWQQRRSTLVPSRKSQIFCGGLAFVALSASLIDVILSWPPRFVNYLPAAALIWGLALTVYFVKQTRWRQSLGST